MPWALHITLVQQGLIVQQEFAKLVMMGSKGRIELAPPLTDDERRDWSFTSEVSSVLDEPSRSRAPCTFTRSTKRLRPSTAFSECRSST